MKSFAVSTLVAFGAFSEMASAYLVWEALDKTPVVMPKTTPVFLQSTNYPGDNCCTIWDYDNYSGDSRTFCHNGGETQYNLDDYGFGDKDASWYCGKTVAYDMCRNYVGDDCRYDHGMSGAGAARNGDSGYHDRMTSIRLRPYDPISHGAVTVFKWGDCHDVSARLYSNENPNYSADYNKEAIWENNMPKDDIDSVYVPFGYQVEFYDQDGFWGDSEVIKGKAYFDGDHEMMPCQNLGSLKNRAASARVTRTHILGPAVGYWEGITHTESIDVTYQVGFDYSHSTED